MSVKSKTMSDDQLIAMVVARFGLRSPYRDPKQPAIFDLNVRVDEVVRFILNAAVAQEANGE